MRIFWKRRRFAKADPVRMKALGSGIMLECFALALVIGVMVHGNPAGAVSSGQTVAAAPSGTEQISGDGSGGTEAQSEEEQDSAKKYIKYVEFNVSYEALDRAYELDVESYGKEDQVHLNWIELLAYAGARGGGEFNKKSQEYIETVAAQLKDGTPMDTITRDMEYYNYYLEAYSTVLGGMVGEYEKKQSDGSTTAGYGLKAYFPIAKGFDYSDYDDFGAKRSYGYSRPHLGHDMMGMVGSPIIAVEDGYIEALGWNQYGGWRIGIRTNDKKRYYYFAHLRQNRPYAEGLEEGDQVKAGDVIGYMGHTGYSTTENTNNIETIHLHIGLELIFDESQKESDNEIWVDCYPLTRFLARNRSEVVRNDETKEWTRAE